MDTEQLAKGVARRLMGARPRTGMNAQKAWDACAAGAAEGLLQGAARTLNLQGDLASKARQSAEQALMSRIVRATPEQREKLKARIALIRSHQGDNLPEVQSAMIALEFGNA